MRNGDVKILCIFDDLNTCVSTDYLDKLAVTGMPAPKGRRASDLWREKVENAQSHCNPLDSQLTQRKQSTRT